MAAIFCNGFLVISKPGNGEWKDSRRNWGEYRINLLKKRTQILLDQRFLSIRLVSYQFGRIFMLAGSKIEKIFINLSQFQIFLSNFVRNLNSDTNPIHFTMWIGGLVGLQPTSVCFLHGTKTENRILDRDHSKGTLS